MRKISISKISALLFGLGMWLQTGLASATLIGDEVSYELSLTSVDFSVANGSGVTTVGPGVEVDPIIGTSPFLALDVASSSFELVYDDATIRAIRKLEFDLTDLDWTDQPGEVLSANFAINDFADANASINTTADSVSLVLDNQDGNLPAACQLAQ